MRARLVRLVALALAATLACRSAPPATAPGTVTFRFAPPDGTTLVQQQTTTRESQLPGFVRRHERSTAKAAIEYRRTPSGYFVASTMLSTETMRDGRVTPDPLAELLRDVVVTYRVRDDGTLEGVDGLGGLVDRAAAALPADAFEPLAEGLREEALVARETADWNERIGELVGKTVSIGQTLEGQTSFTLPNGAPIVYHTRTTFTRFESCGRARCVRIEQKFHSDPAALAGSAPAAPGPGLWGHVRRLVDPSTMLLHGEEFSRTIAMELEDPKLGLVPVTLREERRYTFEYR